MKYWAFFLLLPLIPFISGLECQYTETQVLEKSQLNYYVDGELKDISPPFAEADRFKVWKESLGTTYTYEFYIINNLKFPVDLIVYYNVDGVQKSQSLSLDPLGNKRITGTYNQGGSGLDGNSVYFEYQNIEEKNETHSETIQVCLTCQGNSVCLNDNQACTFDNECGSGICNIAGFCGNEKIVNCPSGTKNCNDKSCLVPSTKEAGEAYSCEWECASEKGEEGICEERGVDILKNIFLTLALLVFLGAGSWYFFMRTLGEREQKKIAEKINLLEAKILEENYELEKLKKTKDQDAKILESIRLQKEQVKEERFKLDREKRKLKKSRLTPFTNKQGRKVIINENGYEVFPDSGKLFHRWWFEQKKGRKIKKDHEIHHKDFDKRNNDISNLQEVTPEEHRDLHLHRFNR